MIDSRTLAAIHVAKKGLGLHDDDYRAMLKAEGGVDSSRDLDDAGARRVMLWFENHGFTGTNSRKGTAGDRRPIVQKARALWISLWQLDEVGDRRDSALDAFARRTTGKDTLHFCTNGEAGQVVEALKSWMGRVTHVSGVGEMLLVAFEQERRLQERLGPETARATLTRSVPMQNLTPKQLRDYVARLGAEVRRFKLGQRHKSLSLTKGE